MKIVGEVVQDSLSIDFIRSPQDVEDFGRMMARAFLNYPVPMRGFADHPEDREDWIFRLVSKSAQNRLDADRLTPIARLDGQIVGGANVTFHNQPSNPLEAAWFEEFLQEAGPTAADFFTRFIAATESFTLPEPHTYLVMLGVDPSAQGKGVGKMLIEKVVEMSRDIPDCQGVALDTEEEGNLKIYEACGFTVQGKTSVDDMPVWSLWRPLDS